MELITKSIWLDYKILLIKHWSLVERLIFIFKKYLSIISLLFKGSTHLKFRSTNMYCSTISDVGTFQASICDVYEDLYVSEILSKEFPIVIDVGGNIGQFTNAIKIFYPGATVYVFEPDKKVYKTLLKNIENLSNIQSYNFGLGTKTEELPFYISNLSLESTFEKPTDFNLSRYTIDHLLINALDNVDEIKKLQSIDLLKIDVEGFEMSVLAGAEAALSKSNVLLIEVSLDRSTHESNLDVLSFIKKVQNTAKILRLGRPLGGNGKQVCTDFILSLR